MLARAHTFTISGLVTQHVVLEVDIRAGLPAIVIAGLPRGPAGEARDRVRSAIRNSGYELPARRITVNLVPPETSGFARDLDLALALAVLAASGQIEPTLLERAALLGELGLDGSSRASRWTAAIALGAREAGFTRVPILCPASLDPRVCATLHLTPVAGLRGAALALRPPERPRRRERAA